MQHVLAAVDLGFALGHAVGDGGGKLVAADNELAAERCAPLMFMPENDQTATLRQLTRLLATQVQGVVGLGGESVVEVAVQQNDLGALGYGGQGCVEGFLIDQMRNDKHPLLHELRFAHETEVVELSAQQFPDERHGSELGTVLAQVVVAKRPRHPDARVLAQEPSGDCVDFQGVSQRHVEAVRQIAVNHNVSLAPQTTGRRLQQVAVLLQSPLPQTLRSHRRGASASVHAQVQVIDDDQVHLPLSFRVC